MADNTAIEWCDATWNVVLGCDRVTRGCDGCYAIRTARRMGANPDPKIADAYAGLVEQRDGRLDWTGQVNLVEARLALPLHWTKPRKIFVNAQSDLFHDDVPDEFIARVWAVMAATPQHTYQILTKRHGRMRSLLRNPNFSGDLLADVWFHAIPRERRNRGLIEWPLRNVWLGVSVEDQQRADLRIPALLDTPAAVRFLSCEPLLGPVDLSCGNVRPGFHAPCDGMCRGALLHGIDWVIVGGESGPDARPMHPAWARQLRDQCVAAGVPYFLKQRGEWTWDARPEDSWYNRAPLHYVSPLDGRVVDEQTAIADGGPFTGVDRVGKRAAGRELDGRTWDQYPAVPA